MFKDITLPEMWGVITATFLLRWIWNFNKFTDVWLLTRNVDTLPIFTYKTAFANFEMGLGLRSIRSPSLLSDDVRAHLYEPHG